MNEVQEKLELETEFDRMLLPIRRKVFRAIGILICTILPAEALVIFGWLTDAGALRLQTFHGAAVGLGALVIFAVSMLLVLLPTKLMSYKAYTMSKAAAEAASRSERRVTETMDRIDEKLKEANAEQFIARLEKKMDTLNKTLGGDDPPKVEEFAEVTR